MIVGFEVETAAFAEHFPVWARNVFAFPILAVLRLCACRIADLGQVGIRLDIEICTFAILACLAIRAFRITNIWIGCFFGHAGIVLADLLCSALSVPAAVRYFDRPFIGAAGEGIRY